MAFALVAARPNSHPFEERQISLTESVKIGRAVAKAKSSKTNGIFDCKVLSRNHALLWYENEKFMLQDTKSSNGTYVNNVRLSRGSEESEPCELKSGDVLQFGVEVVENSKNMTHGCIIGSITLFHEDGTEATRVQEESHPGVLTLLSIDKTIQPQELWQLSQFLQDALHREQMLENKLVTLQKMISNSHAASEDTFQGFIQEDKLLSRLETLENQLEIVSKDITLEDAQSELVSYQEDRLHYESSAKETLQKILSDKIEALQKSSDFERLLSNAEDEGNYLKCVNEKTQEELHELMEKYRERLDEIQELKDGLKDSNTRQESIFQNNMQEQEKLKLQLEEAERRGSSLAVEVESLQAECDFTKKQLEAVQDRLQQQLQEVGEDSLDVSDSEKDHPFASDHATLEKEVKNKSAYIQNLKEQLAEVRTELMKAKENTTFLSTKVEANEPIANKEIANCEDAKPLSVLLLTVEFNKIEELEKTLTLLKDSLIQMAATVQKGDSLNLQCLFWEDFASTQKEISNLTQEDQLKLLQQSLIECTELVKIFNDDIKYLGIAIQRIQDENENETSDDNIKNDLLSAQNELEVVRQQIITLGEKLIEEQESNKKTKELAAVLEHELYEAHKHMDIEQLDKSMSNASLQSARKLADEMQKQASDYAKVAGKEKVEMCSLLEENETLKMKVGRLESECKKLKQENIFISKSNDSILHTQKQMGVSVSSYENIELPHKEHEKLDEQRNNISAGEFQLLEDVEYEGFVVL